MNVAVLQCGCCYQRAAPGFGNFLVVDAALNYNKTVAYELFKPLSSQQDAGVTLAFVSAWKQTIQASHYQAHIWLTPCWNEANLRFIPSLRCKAAAVLGRKPVFKGLLARFMKYTWLCQTTEAFYVKQRKSLSECLVGVGRKQSAGFPSAGGRGFNWLLLWFPARRDQRHWNFEHSAVFPALSTTMPFRRCILLHANIINAYTPRLNEHRSRPHMHKSLILHQHDDVMLLLCGSVVWCYQDGSLSVSAVAQRASFILDSVHLRSRFVSREYSRGF